jgi:hypothetical protein
LREFSGFFGVARQLGDLPCYLWVRGYGIKFVITQIFYVITNSKNTPNPMVKLVKQGDIGDIRVIETSVSSCCLAPLRKPPKGYHYGQSPRKSPS